MSQINFPENPSDGQNYPAPNGVIYVYVAASNQWVAGYQLAAVGATGSTGPVGPRGTGIELKGSVPTVADLSGISNPQIGDTWIVESSGDGYSWNGSSWTNIGQLVGPEGPQGTTGSTGAEGPQGATGPQGPQGSTGAQGDPGTGGGQGATGSTGPEGPQGATGADSTVEGPQGSTGPQGTTGATGPQGNPGNDSTVRGPQGATGATGLTGATGAGAAGVSPIPSVILSDDLTTTARFTDSSFRADVVDVNGANGPFTYKLKAKVTGDQFVYAETDTISNVVSDSNLPQITAIAKVTGGTSQFNFSWEGNNNANSMPSAFFSDSEAFTSNAKYDINGNSSGATYTTGTFRIERARYTFSNAQVGDYIFMRLSTSNDSELYNDGWTISGNAVFDDFWNVSSSPSTNWYRSQAIWDNTPNDKLAFIRIRLTATSGTFDFRGKSQLAGFGFNSGFLGANGSGTSESVYTVTFSSGAGLSNLSPGLIVSTAGGKRGVIDEINTGNNTAIIRGLSGGALVNGEKLRLTTGSLVTNATQYCDINADGDVSGLLASDPGYISFNGFTPYFVNFPDKFGTRSPDQDLPDGVNLSVSVEMTGGAGSGVGTDTIVPVSSTRNLLVGYGTTEEARASLLSEAKTLLNDYIEDNYEYEITRAGLDTGYSLPSSTQVAITSAYDLYDSFTTTIGLSSSLTSIKYAVVNFSDNTYTYEGITTT